MPLLDGRQNRSLVSEHGRRLALLSGCLLLATAGCSLLYDVSGVQCSDTSDCQRLGPAFEGTMCQRSFCVTTNTGTGGDGGGGGDPEGCTSNAQCIDADPYGRATACIDGECIKLIGPGCPWVIGLGEGMKNLRQPAPIIIGAYAPMDDIAPSVSTYVMNYELAIDEMNRETSGGLTGGPGGSSRPFIAVLCGSIENPDLAGSMDHLIEDLRVPAIIAALNPPDLKELFNTKGLPNDVFFMSPIDADTTLTTLPDSGLLWHMLPEGQDLAVGYVALVREVEKYLRQERELDLAEPIKVALVEARSQFLLDIGTKLRADLTFNGDLGTKANEDSGHFLAARTDAAAQVDDPDVTKATDALLDFEPDIVISLGTEESLVLIHDLDARWAPTLGPKPFYVVSPMVSGLAALTTLDAAKGRLMGVNFAGAEDTTLYDELQRNLRLEYGAISGLDGKENFYDAVYYVMYAIAAAGSQGDLSGRDVKNGLARVIDMQSPTSFPVGPGRIPDALAYLTSPNSRFALEGTLGPPSFNEITGARDGRPSYFCVANGERIQDALLYDPENHAVTGTQSCIADFPVP